MKQPAKLDCLFLNTFQLIVNQYIALKFLQKHHPGNHLFNYRLQTYSFMILFPFHFMIAEFGEISFLKIINI
jgi:hypothetical protein